MKNKFILVSAATVDKDNNPKASIVWVRNTFMDALNLFTLVPLIISGGMSDEAIDTLYELSSGIIFSGGNDINASLYEQTPHSKAEVYDDRRDTIELHILKKAIQDKKPFIGICRGAQLFAVCAGGTLYQYLPDISDEQHGLSEGESYVHLFTQKGECIHIEHNTLAHSIFGEDTIFVPSGHHQAIDSSGSLMVSGKSTGGIKEIVEAPHLPFHIGIQGHIETSKYIYPLMKKFNDATNEYIQKK